MLPRLTLESLQRATGCALFEAYRYLEPLQRSAFRWGIDTPNRLSAWLAQLAHESSLFTKTEESLYYSSSQRLIKIWPSRFRLPQSEDESHQDRLEDGKRNALLYIRNPYKLAEFVYGGRMGNNPEGSGDGWKFRGRGLIQLTGRRNVTRYQNASGQQVLDDPDRLAIEPELAADSAGWFWALANANSYADRNEIEAVTMLINGGRTGIDERIALTQRSLKVLQG